MSKLITVRLPAELVTFIDGLVASGQAPSRAIVITDALERDRRRRMAMRDAAIYSGLGDGPDGFVELAVFNADHQVDLD